MINLKLCYDIKHKLVTQWEGSAQDKLINSNFSELFHEVIQTCFTRTRQTLILKPSQFKYFIVFPLNL